MDVGSWTDFGSSGIESVDGDNYNAIDPNLFALDDTYVMNFGSFWADIFKTGMSDPPSTTSGGTPYNVIFNSTGTHAVDGSYEYDGYYYIFFSSGTCYGYDSSMLAQGEEYKIMVCRSSDPTGDFVDANGVSCLENGGTEVLGSHDNVYGPGGQGVYNDPTYGPILYYHYVDTTIGCADGDKQFGWNVISRVDRWPTV